MVHSGYHPLKHCPLRLVLGWSTVDIIPLSIVLFGWYLDGVTVDVILLSIVLLGWILDGAKWISSS